MIMKNKIKSSNKIKMDPAASIAMLALLIATAAVSMMVGRYSISFGDMVSILSGNYTDELESSAIVLYARTARVAAAVMIGAALAAAGAAYQGIFRNPVVSPDILGAATGAGFGAAFAILLGGSALAVQLSAFAFGLAAVAAAYAVSSRLTGGGGGGITITLVLTGMVISSMFSAFISIIKFVGDPYDTLPSITFWLMGGLTYITKEDVLIMLIPFAISIVPLMLLRWRLNVLSLDDEEAESLGVDTKKLRLAVIICATLMSSASVAAGGMIGWVGLIVPHIARMISGPDYTKMLPCSVLTGAIFLLIMDDLSRCLFAQEIPLGVLTAIIGAPFFLYLLFRGKKSFM